MRMQWECSGMLSRQYMEQKQPKYHLKKEQALVSRLQKSELNRHKAFVIWLTGLPASGKSTIARELEISLFNKGVRTLVLDGDNIRLGINRDLDFTAKGRKENIRRVAEIANLLNDAGVVVITAFISPFKADRKMARQIIGNKCFIEVFVDAPLELCISRDPKGLYNKALKGMIADFTGVSSPYEIPDHPNLAVNTAELDAKQSVDKIILYLEKVRMLQL
jgi:adenylyl-sulfate kinase